MSNWKFKPKLYPHFDKIVMSKKQVENLVKEAKEVAQHSFFPFIEYQQKNRKLKKGKKKIRPIKYASHMDSQIFSYYRNEINNNYEKKLKNLNLTKNIIAYRKISLENQPQKGKSNIHFAKEAFDTVVKIKSCIALTFDISGFFENLNHNFLKEKLKEVMKVDVLPPDYKSILKALTNYSVVQHDDCYEKLGLIKRSNKKIKYQFSRRYTLKKKKVLCSKEIYRKKIVSKGLVKKNNTSKGIPQGASLSDVLANLYMLDFDKKMKELEKETNGYYRRYSDDILWICSEKEAEKIKKKVKELIKTSCGNTLTISESKTTETHFKENASGEIYCTEDTDNFEYLGFRFDGKQAFFRNNTISRYKRKTIFTINKYVKIYDERHNKTKSSKPLKDFVNRARIFKEVFYKNKKLRKKEPYGNFMNYVERAKKVFNENDKRLYSLSNKQFLKHKKWIHKKIDEKIKQMS